MIRIGHGFDAHRFSEEGVLLTEMSISAEDFISTEATSHDEGSLPNEDSLPAVSIVMGGVEISHAFKLIAHSDGDVLIHALCDALLGALGFGDIGKHFPDTSAEFKDIDSRILLRKVMQEVVEAEYKVTNVDMTIIAQAPKMSPHIDAMQDNLAKDLNIQSSQVNVKATTTEGMGYIGRKEGIAAHAVVLLEK